MPSQSPATPWSSARLYVFVRDGTNWTQQAYLKASNTEALDFFGLSVAISGETVVVGAPRESSRATGINGDQNNNGVLKAGATYVFQRRGTNWSQQAYLKASNNRLAPYPTPEGFLFGWTVGISGDSIVVGAHEEPGNATGVNGDAQNDGALYAGAAYVFKREGKNWAQEAYLKASNTEAEDLFGHSVAISGDVVVVGALQESSNGTGINGNQGDNSADGAGAAYIFVRNDTNWMQQAYVKASDTVVEGYFGSVVAASGSTVVIGADASSKAYVFAGAGTGPRLRLDTHAVGSCTVAFQGAPEVIYEMRRAPNLDGPWSSVGIQTANPSGLIEFLDTNAPAPQAFYRVSQP